MNTIIDPPQLVYLLLGGLLVVTGAIAAQKQERNAALAFGGAFLLMVLVFVLDRVFESPREEVVRRANLMAMAADAKNADAFVAHCADKVEVQTGAGQTKVATRDELKKSGFWHLLTQFNVHVAVWGFDRDDVKHLDDGTVEIGFFAKGEEPGGKQIPVYVRATFRKQSDGSFKMSALRAFDAVRRDEAFPIPNFP